jgi:predicted MFS family arabinose efflux permease
VAAARRAGVDGALLRLYAATFLYSLAHALGVPLLPPFLKLEFGATLTFVGVVVGLYGLMQIVLRLPMGDMADRRGRKPSLVLAFACTVASSLFFAFAQNAWWSVPGVILFGFAGGIYWVAANSYLFDRVGEGDVAKATSDYSLVFGLAFLVGPPLGHLIADTAGFRWAFLTYFATSILGLLLVLTLPEVKPAPRPRPTQSPYVRAWRLLRHPALVLSAIGTFTYSTLFSTLNAFFELHVLAVGLSVTVAGLLLGARQGAATAVRVGLPRILRAQGPVRVLYAGILVTALGTALVPFAPEAWSLLAVVLVTGAATGVMIPANLMLVHEGAPKGERGLANGIYGTMLGIGSAFAPVTYGFIGARLGLAWTFWSAALLAVALLGVLALNRRRVQPSKPAK